MPADTIPVTIELPKAQVTFLREYAQQHQITISQLVDSLLKQFRLSEEYDLHSELEKHSGIIPSHIDVKKEYYDYLEEKYR